MYFSEELGCQFQVNVSKFAAQSLAKTLSAIFLLHDNSVQTLNLPISQPDM